MTHESSDHRQKIIDEDRKVIMSLDVKLGPDATDNLLLYDDDDVEQKIDEFAFKHGLPTNKKEKLSNLIRESLNLE